MSVDDVAAAVLTRTGRIDTYKLQKLVYYCQAWHLVWDEEPLFDAPIEAWANGPVVPELYSQHRGSYRVSTWRSGNEDALTESEKETVDAVVGYYGEISGHELSQLTHREDPWRDARVGTPVGKRSNKVIPLDSLLGYYGGLVDASEDQR